MWSATFGGKRELYLAALDRYLDEHAFPGFQRLATDRRGLLAVRGVVRSPARMVIAFGCLAAAISAFVSNTATVAMLFPIALGMISSVSSISAADSGHDLRRSRISVALLLMVAYGASIGGLLTPVGAPHQLIGRQLIEETTGESINFLHWVGLFAPIVLVMFVVLCVVLLLLNRPEVKRLEGAEEYVAAERAKLHTFSPGERNTCIAFAVAVLLWVTPSVLQAVLDSSSSARRLARATLAEARERMGLPRTHAP